VFFRMVATLNQVFQMALEFELIHDSPSLLPSGTPRLVHDRRRLRRYSAGECELFIDAINSPDLFVAEKGRIRAG